MVIPGCFMDVDMKKGTIFTGRYKVFKTIYHSSNVWQELLTYSSPPLTRRHLLQLKRGLIRGVASLKGDKYVVFYYLIASEIWPDKRGDFGCSGLKRGVLMFKENETTNNIFYY